MSLARWRAASIAALTVTDRDRIVAVGKNEAVRIPARDTVIHGRGTFLIPGLCDMHVRLVFHEDIQRIR
jgi:imidazolonepropionase-like amidohydrolase